MDPKVKEFYVSMGYSQQQVVRAYEHSIKQKVDILDAINYISQKSHSTPQVQPKKPNNFVQPQPKNQNEPRYSFLVPASKIKFSEYEVIYSIKSKQNILNSKYQLREANFPVGLLNISNCCYLNSLLQCYFLMDDFKIALLSADPIDNISEILAENKTKFKRVVNQFELLNKIKRFFTIMSLTSKKYLDPTQILQNLVDSVGEKISYGQEKDLSEINIMIIERISQGLSFCKKYYEEQQKINESKNINASFIQSQPLNNRYNSIYNPQTGTIKALFYGIKVQYYDHQDLKDEPPIVNDFTGIILNPSFGTLYNALEEEFNFSVEIKGKNIKKQMFIRESPQYLFMYINRTQYDRDIGQMHKNQQKFSFDFTFYLDRYLQKYRGQKSEKDLIITELVNKRNRIKEQINSLQLLYKKMEECYKYAQELEGWEDKLPSQEDFQEENHNLRKSLLEVENDLQKIESREEQYHLMYIFVHRGDAASGHYWGYGRNGEKWYKFDINCRQIDQEQILIDLQKCLATPYALLYVKKPQLPNFKYNYYLETSNFEENSMKTNELLDLKLADQIMKENITMHNEIKVKNNQIFKKKTYLDYLSRFKVIKNTSARQKEEIAQVKNTKISKMHFQYCYNFSLFLLFKNQIQLYKFSLFQQSILFASGNKIDSEKLMQDKEILQIIQKKFRKSCKGEFSLKNYAVRGKDLQKYKKLHQEYQLSIFQIIWVIFFTILYQKLLTQLSKFDITLNKFCPIDIKNQLKACLTTVLKLLNVRALLRRSQQYLYAEKFIQVPLYLSQVNNQISKLAIFKLMIYGFKIQSLHAFIDLEDIAAQQIAVINAQNSIVIGKLFQIPQFVIESAQSLAGQYFKNIKRSSLNKERNLSQLKSSRKTSQAQLSPTKNSLFSTKSNQKAEIQEKGQQKMINSIKENLLIIDVRQSWKIQDLENQKKFNISDRVKNFLQKTGNILQFYKMVLSENKVFSISQIAQKGILLNQEKHQQQSLI